MFEKLDISLYPASEIGMRAQIDCLMKKWKEHTKIPDNWFSSDGFYPYYTKQRYRILFVGRESRGLGGRDFISVLYDAYKGIDGNRQRIGGIPMNRLSFQRRLFYLAYGFLNDFPEFKSVPKANIIAKNFAEKDGLSFAFMEISKISNPDDNNASSNWGNIIHSIKRSTSEGHNFIRDEIEILAPDIIVGSGIYNLHEVMMCRDIERLDNSVYLLNDIAKKRILYFTSYHFSAPRKDGDIGLYERIGKAFEQFLPILDSQSPKLNNILI